MPSLNDIKKVVEIADKETLKETCFVGYRKGVEICRINSPSNEAVLSVLRDGKKKGADQWKVIYPYEPRVLDKKDLVRERVKGIVDRMSAEEKAALHELLLDEVYEQPVIATEFLNDN